MVVTPRPAPPVVSSSSRPASSPMRAAACYVRLEAMRSVAATVPGTAVDDRVPPEWPWARCGWKPKDRRSNLVRAGALIAAELDRMDREGAANA